MNKECFTRPICNFFVKMNVFLIYYYFVNDIRQFSKIDTSIVFYITFDFHHHFPKKIYGALEEIKLYNLLLRNQGFH